MIDINAKRTTIKMRTLKILILFVLLTEYSFGQVRTIHIFVALCDNEFQGIVPVPESLGNGKKPQTNLYWGAAYGIKSYFKNKTSDWKLISNVESENEIVLERLLFKHSSKDIYMLADAYDGEQIQICIEDFLLSSDGQQTINVKNEKDTLYFGGQSNLVAYVGHDGLMDFDVNIDYTGSNEMNKDVMILACYSKEYFSSELSNTKAKPILWTTHLMAPEAYTLKSAIDGWILNETGVEIKERAAQSYNQYQKCGIRGARNLFTTGY